MLLIRWAMITETYRIVWVCIENVVQNGLGMSKIILFHAPKVQWCSGQHALRRQSDDRPVKLREAPGSIPG